MTKYFIMVWLMGISMGVYGSQLLLDKAEPYRVIIEQEVNRYFSSLQDIHYIPALISHETCPSPGSKKCWNPRTSFSTTREYGAGLGQLTRAYTKSGQIRFDKLAELRTSYHDSLGELRWSNVLDRPDLQIRALVIMAERDHRRFKDQVRGGMDLYGFMSAAYNGGAGDVLRDIRLCQQTKGCDPSRWFGHVETQSVKSNKPLYAGRSAFEINRDHARDVVLVKMPLFAGSWLRNDTMDEPTLIDPTQELTIYELISSNEQCSIYTDCVCKPLVESPVPPPVIPIELGLNDPIDLNAQLDYYPVKGAWMDRTPGLVNQYTLR